VRYINFGRKWNKRFKQAGSSSSLEKMVKDGNALRDANELGESSMGT